MRTATARTEQAVGSLAGQTVVVIGGTSGIGLETARQARTAGAAVILTGRDRDLLDRAGVEVAAVGTSTLDLGDAAGRERFFAGLPAKIDHLLVTGGGPSYAPIADLDFDEALRELDEHLLGALRIARATASRIRPGGSLTLVTGTHARRPGIGLSIAAIEAAAVPVIAANIAVEFAPLRANVIAAGVRRHPAVRANPGRRPRPPPGRTPRHTSDPTCGRGGRRCGTGHFVDDEHGRHRGDVRHRRWAAARPMT